MEEWNDHVIAKSRRDEAISNNEITTPRTIRLVMTNRLVKQGGAMEKEKKSKKSWVTRIIEKIDKKMESKAKQQPCCAQGKNKKENSCC